MSRLEQMTALFSLIGVGYLIGVYRMVPVMAMVIGVSFAFYGAVKKSVHLDAGLSLFAETLFVTPIALLFLYLQRNEWSWKPGSLSWNAVSAFSNSRSDYFCAAFVI